MKYPRSLPDTPEAKAWWDGAYEFFKKKGTKVGYPPFETPDGEVIQLHYSSNQASVNTEKGTGLKLRKVSQQKKDASVRKESLKQQTYGDTKLADTPTPKGFNDHHIRPRGVIQPFFEGLNEADSKELSRYASEDLLMPVGDHPANNARIPDPVHDQHHAYARANPGLERGIDMDKFKNASLSERKKALKLYKEQIQPALDEDLFRRMQQFNIENGSVKLNNKALKRTTALLPLAGVGVGLTQMSAQAAQGDYMGAAATGVETAVGEIPVVGDALVNEFQGRAAGAGSDVASTDAQRQMVADYEATSANKIVSDPINELEWAAKNPGEALKNIRENDAVQATGTFLKNVGGAILLGF